MPPDLEHLAWSDCALIGQTWVNDGRDLQLVLQREDGRQTTIVFTWAPEWPSISNIPKMMATVECYVRRIGIKVGRYPGLW